MQIPKKASEYIKKVIDNLKNGEILFDIKKDKKTMDIIVKDSMRTNTENVMKDMQKCVENINYGKIALDIESNANDVQDININSEKRERFDKKGASKKII